MSIERESPVAARRPDQMPAQSKFSELTGVEIVSADTEHVVCRMAVTDALTNRNGALHGGAVMTLADNAAGTAAFISIPPERSNTTIESKTNFLRGVAVGDMLTAICETVHRGRTTMVFQVTMTRGDGKTAAITTQTHMILDWQGQGTRADQT